MGFLQSTYYSGLDVLQRIIRKMSDTPNWEMPELYFLKPLKIVILNTMGERIKLFCCCGQQLFYRVTLRSQDQKDQDLFICGRSMSNSKCKYLTTGHATKSDYGGQFSTLRKAKGWQVSPVPTLLRKSWTHLQITERFRNYYEYDENCKICSVPDTSLLLSHSLL